MTHHSEKPDEARFVLIFNELSKAEPQGSISDVSQDELDAIEQISRIVMETTEDRPIFMTST